VHTLTQDDVELLNVAHLVAQKSPDLDTKVGCVIRAADDRGHLQSGYNRFPLNTPWTVDRARRPEKYKYVLHAEEVGIIQSLQMGYPLDGATLYSTQIPCRRCALLIVEVGIARVVSKPFSPAALAKWTDEYEEVCERFAEAGIDLVIQDQKEQVQ